MTFADFTPWSALLGGAMIGLSAVLLMAFAGRIAGISGIAARVLPPYEDVEAGGRLAFLGGLVAAPAVVLLLTGDWPPVTIGTDPATLALAGLLVGFGSAWGAGCTSGHGVCGLSRLSARSFVAVGTFMATAMLTVFAVRHML